MPRIPYQARAGYYDEMRAAKTTTDPAVRWAHLERAHILSQPDPWLHTRNHVAMFALAARQRDRREALGQMVRIIVAAPGSLSGRYPEGNTAASLSGSPPPCRCPPTFEHCCTPTPSNLRGSAPRGHVSRQDPERRSPFTIRSATISRTARPGIGPLRVRDTPF